jgi:hypothetical protein
MRCEIAAHAKQDFSHDWQLPKKHADQRFACGSKSSENVHVYSIGQGEDRHGKYTTL